ncbi:MAG: GTP-binding protein [Pseudomonadota bacterium]
MGAPRTPVPIPTVVIGHVDHGKSTLIGRLLYESGRLPRERITELQARAELYRQRFEFSHFLDAFEEEIAQARTIDTVRVLFHARRTYEIADVPGHAEFTRNMLTGAGDARIAILVLSVVDGIQPQTLEHLRLVAMLGIEHLIVAVTKLDLVDHDEGRFHDVVTAVKPILDGLGFLGSRFIPVVPTSGLNVSKAAEALSWHVGRSLVEALDDTDLTPRTRPMRFVVQGSWDLEDGPLHVGCVLSGRLCTGDPLVFQPSGIEGTLVELRDASGPLETAARGDCVGLRLSTPGLSRGEVGGPRDHAPVPAVAVEADVVFLDDPPHPGEALELVCGPQRVSGVTVEPIATEGFPRPPPGTPEEVGLHPRRALLRFPGPAACLERHSDLPELGRFILRRGGQPCGIGIIRNVR